MLRQNLVQGCVKTWSKYVAQQNWTKFWRKKKCFFFFFFARFSWKISFSLQKEEDFWKTKKKTTEKNWTKFWLKRRPVLDQVLTLQHIYIHVSLYMSLYCSLSFSYALLLLLSFTLSTSLFLSFSLSLLLSFSPPLFSLCLLLSFTFSLFPSFSLSLLICFSPSLFLAFSPSRFLSFSLSLLLSFFPSLFPSLILSSLFSFSLSFFLSLFLSFFFSLSLSRSPSLSLYLSFSLSLFLFVSLSLCLSFSLSLFLFVSLSLCLSFSLSLFLFVSLSLCLSFSPSLCLLHFVSFSFFPSLSISLPLSLVISTSQFSLSHLLSASSSSISFWGFLTISLSFRILKESLFLSSVCLSLSILLSESSSLSFILHLSFESIFLCLSFSPSLCLTSLCLSFSFSFRFQQILQSVKCFYLCMTMLRPFILSFVFPPFLLVHASSAGRRMESWCHSLWAYYWPSAIPCKWGRSCHPSWAISTTSRQQHETCFTPPFARHHQRLLLLAYWGCVLFVRLCFRSPQEILLTSLGKNMSRFVFLLRLVSALQCFLQMKLKWFFGFTHSKSPFENPRGQGHPSQTSYQSSLAPDKPRLFGWHVGAYAKGLRNIAFFRDCSSPQNVQSTGCSRGSPRAIHTS